MSCRIDSYAVLCALGSSSEEILGNLADSKREYLSCSETLFSERAVMVGAVHVDLPPISSELAHFNSRNNRMALWAFTQLKERIEELKSEFGAHRIGIVIGSSTSGIASLEAALKEHAQSGKLSEGYDYKQSELSSTSAFLAEVTGVSGPVYTVSTACTSSMKALSSAKTLLESGLCDAVISGGIDSLCHLTVEGFGSLELLSESVANPLSNNRDGINIGEGGGLCILTKDKGGVQIAGVGDSCDAYHISAPHPEGEGSRNALEKAMLEAGVTPQQVDYVQLHGTGTGFNDMAESKAVYSLFGDRTPCSSIKPYVGHTLGASGALGVLLSAMILEQSPVPFFPGQKWDGVRDKELAPVAVLSENRPVKTDAVLHLLINNIAFGGNNCALLLSYGGSDD